MVGFSRPVLLYWPRLARIQSCESNCAAMQYSCLKCCRLICFSFEIHVHVITSIWILETNAISFSNWSFVLLLKKLILTFLFFRDLCPTRTGQGKYHIGLFERIPVIPISVESAAKCWTRLSTIKSIWICIKAYIDTGVLCAGRVSLSNLIWMTIWDTIQGKDWHARDVSDSILANEAFWNTGKYVPCCRWPVLTILNKWYQHTYDSWIPQLCLQA